MGRNIRKRRSSLAIAPLPHRRPSRSAGVGWSGRISTPRRTRDELGARTRPRPRAAQVATIDCPDVGQKLTNVPEQARRARSTGSWRTSTSRSPRPTRGSPPPRQAQAGDAELRPERDRRPAEGEAVGDHRPDPHRHQARRRPGPTTWLDARRRLHARRPRPDRTNGAARTTAASSNGGQNNGGQQQRRWPSSNGRPAARTAASAEQRRPAATAVSRAGNGGQGGNGPVAADFVDITKVQPQRPAGASRRTRPTAAARAARSPRTAASTRTRTSTRTT